MRISKSLFLELSRCKRYYDYYADEPFEPINYDIIDHLSSDEDETLKLTEAQEVALTSLHNQVEVEASRFVKQSFGGDNIDRLSPSGQFHVEGTLEGYVLTAEVDILNTKADTVNMIEVKASTTSELAKLGFKAEKVFYPLFDKEEHVFYLHEETHPYTDEKHIEKYLKARKKLFNRFDKVGRHVYDLAFQRFVYERSETYDYAKKHRYYLALLNKNYRHDGYQPYQIVVGEHVINLVDLTQITLELQPLIADDLKQVFGYIENRDRTYRGLIKACEKRSTRECPFLLRCNPYLGKDYHVNELMSCDYKKTAVFAHQENKAMIVDLNPHDLIDKPLWQMQYEAVAQDDVRVDKPALKKLLDALRYPVYHLDFESFASPLPRFKGEKPYDQHVFQVSLHIERAPGVCHEDQDHVEFLAEDHEDCREKVAQFLAEHIDLTGGGTVLAWHKYFERDRLRELATAVPKFRSSLLAIEQALVDLKDFFKGNGDLPILHKKELHGSYSIKYVLPAYTSIRYDGMLVGNGLEATASYATYPMLDSQTLDQVFKAMRAYCKQDTWAMVALLDVCRTLVDA